MNTQFKIVVRSNKPIPEESELKDGLKTIIQQVINTGLRPPHSPSDCDVVASVSIENCSQPFVDVGAYI